MKKFSLGLLFLLASTLTDAFAVLPNRTTTPNAVCVPGFSGGFSFGLTGLYWRATMSPLDFAVTVNGTGTEDRFHDIDDNFNWGYGVNIGYLFACSGNDVQLSYLHWKRSHQNTAASSNILRPLLSANSGGANFVLAQVQPNTFITGTSQMGGSMGTFLTILPAGFTITVPFTSATAKINIDDNTLDLNLGQTINVGSEFYLRWFSGLRYSKLKRSLEVDLDATTPAKITGTTFTSFFEVNFPNFVGSIPGALTPVFDVLPNVQDIIHQHSDFNGLGPRFGTDLSYHLGGGIGIITNVSAAVLVGRSESRFDETLGGTATITIDPSSVVTLGQSFVNTIVTASSPSPLPFNLVIPTPIHFRHPKQTRIVPNIDAKLGLDWSYAWNRCTHSQLTIEAGYLVSYYFNPIDRLSASELTAPQLTPRERVNVNFNGPYLSVQVSI